MWDEYTLGTTALSLAFLNNKNSHFEKTDDVEIMWNLINVIQVPLKIDFHHVLDDPLSNFRNDAFRVPDMVTGRIYSVISTYLR